MRRRYLRNRARGNIVYPGLIAAWSAKGKSNDDADRAILKDLTGNGHDITLNGFSFSEMSGYGGYKTNMLNWKYNKNSAVILSSQNKFIIYNTLEIVTHFWDYISNPPLGTIHRPSFKLKISGLNEDEAIYYTYRDGEDFSVQHGGNLYNGINIFPEINAEIVTKKLPYTTVFEILNQHILDKEITFEILPEYPDALVFDGVNDYGINEDTPILTDYTIIAKRKTNDGLGALLNKGESTASAFVFEGGSRFISNTFSFGFGAKVDIINSDISYQSKNKYNGITITAGTAIDTNKILLGKFRFWQGAFYSAYLFDRSLDEQEIKAFIRKYIDPEYLLPSEPDCYYDFSKGGNDDETKDTIKDYSGNGKDAVAHNFAWNEEGSGYKDGALYFDGVDDYVNLNAFDSGFKTMFMLVKPFVAGKILYDQRQKMTINNQFAIYFYEPAVAYNSRNTKGITYINSVLNNKLLAKELINKKQCITILNNNLEKNIPIIGTRINHELNEKMALYKFLGFKEALTEEQIQAVIKKYNLLDGVDEIEVS